MMTEDDGGTELVESYADLASAWIAEGRPGHGYGCPDLPCADLRAHQRRVLPPTRIGERTFLTRPPGKRL